MKRILPILFMGALLFAQTEVLSRVKIDRRVQSQLAQCFESLPERVELYVTGDSTYLCEAYYENQKITLRLSSEEYRGILQDQTGQVRILENSRTSYLIGQSALSINLYSWSLPTTIFSQENNEVTIDQARLATGLFTPFVYSGALFFLTRNTRISNGAAYGSFLAGIEGAAHGGLLFNTLRVVFPGSLVENFTDFYLGQRFGFTPGMFQRKFNHSVFAYGHLLAAYVLAGQEDELDRPGFRQIGTGLSLAEGYASLYLSRNAQDLTFGDALFELRTMMIGSQTLPLILLSVDAFTGGETDIDGRIYSGSALAGFAVGYYLGYKLSSNYDLSGPSGVFSYLIPYLAHGLTAGIGTIVQESSDYFYWKAYPIIFSIVDIGLTAYVYKSMAKPQTQVGMRERGNFNFYLNPAPLFTKNQVIRSMPIAGFLYNF